MNLSKIAIDRPITTIMIFAALIVLGCVSYVRLPVQFLPDISEPGMGVWLHYNRPLSGEEFERQIIEPIESEVAQLSGIKNMWVYGRGGNRAFFRIQLEFGTNAKFRVIELQEKLDRFRRTFTRGALNMHTFSFDSSWENRRFMYVAIQGPRHDPYLQGISIDRLAQRLQEIDGVARADTWGGHEQIIEIAVNEDRMREFNQPIFQLRNTVSSYATDPIFLGEVQEKGQRHFVRLDSQFKKTNDLSNIMLNTEGGLYLRHLADVNDLLLPRDRLSRVDGKPSIIYALEKEAEANPIELSKRVRKTMVQIEESMPEGYSLTVAYDGSEIISDMIRQLMRLAGIGIVLAMLILLAFVRSLRMTLMVCLVIPISIIATFNLMYFSDMSINLITLVGLAIGVGSLLDNSIVVLENIARYRERNKDAKWAAAEGAREVTRPIMALTLTSIIVFLPIVFVKGELQLIFREGALAVIYPLLASMAVALLLVPMAASFFYRRTQNKIKNGPSSSSGSSFKPHGRDGIHGLMAKIKKLTSHTQFVRFRTWYLAMLKSCLRHRVRLVFVIVAVILYTYFYLMGGVNRGGRLQAPEDRESFSVFVFTPEGTRISYTAAIVDKVEDLLKELVPERRMIQSRISDDFAYIDVELVDAKDREREVPSIKESLRKPFSEITEAEVSFTWSRQRGDQAPSVVVTGRNGSIELKGPSQQALVGMIDMIRPLIEQIDSVRDVYSDFEQGELELRFTLDRDTANLLQINAQSLAWQITAAQSRGDASQLRMKREDEDDLEIIFQQVTSDQPARTSRVAEEDEGLSLADMRRIPIYSPSTGTYLPLEDLGIFELVRRSTQVMRKNQQRLVTIHYSLAPTAQFQDVEDSIKAITENFPLPAGFSFEYGGFSQEWEDLSKALQLVLILALILVYMLMASLFESFYQPFIILFTIALAFVPLIWGLLLTETEFNHMGAFGVIFLIGLLPNSGILLVNFASSMRREKQYPRPRAVMLACAYRLRPIFMTVGTTVLGLLPMAITTKGSEGEWVPFAIVVISGLLGSTILTLLLIPGFYFMFEDLAALIKRGVKYVLSLRWIFVFWSSKRRGETRTRVTAYRTFAPRHEPLTIQTWNLTRIYERPWLLRLQEMLPRLRRTILPLEPAPIGIISRPSLPMDDSRKVDLAGAQMHGTTRRQKALAGVNLDIGRGLFGLLGPNGAGKTTLMRLIVGIDQPTRGTCHVCGYDTVKESGKARKLIGYLPQDFGVYGERTAREYLNHFALLKRIMNKRERNYAIDRALEMVNLTDVADTAVGGFSGGMIRRIGLAQIFLKPPRVLIVDEPTAGLDPLERLRFRNLLSQLATERVVVLSTHIVEDIAHSCRNLAIMQEGMITYQGGQEDLIAEARGHVVEIMTDDREWSKLRMAGETTVMQRTPQGLRLRLVFKDMPPADGRIVEPTLEDAYVYHTLVQKNKVFRDTSIH